MAMLKYVVLAATFQGLAKGSVLNFNTEAEAKPHVDAGDIGKAEEYDIKPTFEVTPKAKPADTLSVTQPEGASAIVEGNKTEELVRHIMRQGFNREAAEKLAATGQYSIDAERAGALKQPEEVDGAHQGTGVGAEGTIVPPPKKAAKRRAGTKKSSKKRTRH